MTPLKILDWISGPAGGYMTGPQNDMATYVLPTRIVMLKSIIKKFPTDIWAIRPIVQKDGSTVLCLTFFCTENGEAGWQAPNNFRLSNQMSPVLCPMVINSLPWTSEVSNPTELSYLNGVWDGKYPPLGDTLTHVAQPLSLDWAGDVGRQDTLPIFYHWNQDREIYYLVRGKGLVCWDHSSLDSSGLYKHIETAVFNKFVPLAALPNPIIGFPQGWLP